jgi:hypothetical protein
MKISFSRSSILAALAIAIVLAALPGSVRRFLQTRDPYLFTRHFFEDILARLSGPGRIRFILQPALAVVAGIRDGKRDARAGCPPFLSAMLTRRVHKPSLIVSALVSVRDLIALAIIVDVIAQFLIFPLFYFVVRSHIEDTKGIAFRPYNHPNLLRSPLRRLIS